jgi:type I restriction-modification system DNA methylase subunit
VIGLPSNLFYSTGIPVCILVLKKCKKPDDVLFINAAEHFIKGKRQNQLTGEHIAKIIETYQFRKEEARYSRRVDMAEIEKNDFNLNISRYVSTAVSEAEIAWASRATKPTWLGAGCGPERSGRRRRRRGRHHLRRLGAVGLAALSAACRLSDLFGRNGSLAHALLLCQCHVDPLK